MGGTNTTKAVLTADGRVLIEQPDGTFRRAESRTDWRRLERMTEEEIEAIAAADSDAPPPDDDFPRQAKPIHPPPRRNLTLRLDADVVDWFKQQGNRYQSHINAVLRSYMNARRHGQR